MRTYRFSATVNGKRRSATFSAPDGLESHWEIEAYMDNDRAAYFEFYEGATEADFDAEREDAKAERWGWAVIE